MKSQFTHAKKVKPRTGFSGSAQRDKEQSVRTNAIADLPEIQLVSIHDRCSTPSTNLLMDLVSQQLFNRHWGVVKVAELGSLTVAFANQGYSDDDRARSTMHRFIRNLQTGGQSVWVQAFSEDRYSWLTIIDTPCPEDVAALLDSAVNAAYGDEYYHVHSETGLIRLTLETLSDRQTLKGL